MDQPNTTAWCKAVCTATGYFFTYWTPCSCGWKTPCFSCNTDHLNIAITYIFPDTGLARLPLCQSGRWKDINFSFRVGATFQVWPGQTVNLGRFKLCINSYRIDGRELAITELIPTDGPDEKGYMNWRATNATQYSPYYMGIHCFI
ncbi:TPA: hypothetical protein ACS93H_004943 [Salmonella enterica subsp. enterica serovar Typhimurium]|mgnify:CR=1 FL=1|nr:hypothetical protein [Salmonella enterica]